MLLNSGWVRVGFGVFSLGGQGPCSEHGPFSAYVPHCSAAPTKLFDT